MDFRILGPLEVLDEGRVLTLGGSKQRAVLALLVLHANETLSTDRLIDDLWGGRPPATAAKTVQVHISRLRKALAREAGDGLADDGVVVTRDHGYALELDPERLDARRFERLVAEGRSELAAGRPHRAASLLEEALSLWRGAPLADLAYEPFAQREISRLDDLRLAALEQLIDAKLAVGAHAEVLGRLESLIGEYPYRERLRAQLMLALYRSDRQADALQAYQSARKALVEELGIEPGERLRDLERAILAQDSKLQLAAAEEPAAQSQRGAFVGRAQELGELIAALGDAIAGRGRLFLLAGEPGIGKSRLAEELLGHARARGARVLVGRCWEAGGAPAYWPWVQSLRTYVRQTDAATLRPQLGGGGAALAQILPELRQHFPDLPERPLLDSDEARFRLFDATAEFLRNAAENRPIVLLLDDLHAADAPSLLLLRFLARELGSAQVLLLGAYREVDLMPGQPLTEMLAEVTREPVTRRLSLSGLSEREVAEYVELTAAEIGSAELLARLHEETAGNPLFVGEIVRLLSVEGSHSTPGGEVKLAIPQTVRDVISRRLAHLSEECNGMLVLASVIGREFALDALARVSDLSEGELLELLDEAMAARVVSDVPGAPGRLRFAHVLMRDIVYEGLTTARRVRLHRLAVEALEGLYRDEAGPHLVELAHHSIAGSDFEKGLRYAWRAADWALALLAYEEAARLYQTALDALELADRHDEKARCELLLSLGEAEARAGNTVAAKRAFIEAASIGRRGHPRELARAAAGYGGWFVWERAGNDDLLLPLLEEGLRALSDDELELRARLLARLAGALRDEPSGDRRDRLSREAVDLARQAGDPAVLAWALDGRITAIIAPDTIAECVALGNELRELAERIDDAERVAHGHWAQTLAQLTVGDVNELEARLAVMSRLADGLRSPSQLWGVFGAQAMLALATGRLPEAEELIRRAFALGERAQQAVAVPVHRLQRYTLCDFLGTVEQVAAEIGELVATYPARPVFRCVLAHLHARLGRPQEARQILDDLAAEHFSALPFDQEWLYGISLLAETAELVDDRDSAAVLYGLLVPWAAFNVVDYPEGVRGSVARYLGILATMTKSWDAAELHFEDAIAMNMKTGARPWLAHSQSDYAQMLLARDAAGDRPRALELIEQALATYRELGMETWADRASGLAEAPRVSPALDDRLEGPEVGTRLGSSSRTRRGDATGRFRPDE